MKLTGIMGIIGVQGMMCGMPCLPGGSFASVLVPLGIRKPTMLGYVLNELVCEFDTKSLVRISTSANG